MWYSVQKKTLRHIDAVYDAQAIFSAHNHIKDSISKKLKPNMFARNKCGIIAHEFSPKPIRIFGISIDTNRM